MSYCYNDARMDEETKVLLAIQEMDDTTLFKLASEAKGREEDEWAEWLLTKARKVQKELWAYDEAKDNALVWSNETNLRWPHTNLK